MYIISECAACAVLSFVVTALLFATCATMLLLHRTVMARVQAATRGERREARRVGRFDNV